MVAASSKNTIPRTPMDLNKAIIIHILRPKTAPCIAFLFLFTLLFIVNTLFSFSTTPSSLLVPPDDDIINNSSYLLDKNQSSFIRDVTLLKNRVEGRGLSLSKCDLFDGRWVIDDGDGGGPRSRYHPGSCPFVDVAFNCFSNGRVDLNYTLFRWQPNGCTLPKLDGLEMLELLRGKRLAFVGDSLNRNMWQSLVCILREAVTDKNTVSEISGKHEFKTEGFYSVMFTDYNCTIEFIRSPFLVQEWKMSDQNGTLKDTLRLDMVHRASENYKDADIIIFNTAHWWTHEKTSLGKDFYQEGDYVHSKLSALEAYRKALSTWAKWVDANIDGNRSKVFFRGYSSSHFSGGQWNSGGNCHGEKFPITNSTQVGKYPKMMGIFESIMREMSTPIQFLNITKMTDYRKDGHPSIFRQPPEERQPDAFQDCSHWCLPGVPDAWNELLFAMLAMGKDSSNLKGFRSHT